MLMLELRFRQVRRVYDKAPMMRTGNESNLTAYQDNATGRNSAAVRPERDIDPWQACDIADATSSQRWMPTD